MNAMEAEMVSCSQWGMWPASGAVDCEPVVSAWQKVADAARELSKAIVRA